MPDLTAELLKAEKAVDDAVKDLLKTQEEKGRLVWQMRSRLNKLREVRGRIVARDYLKCPAPMCEGGWVRPVAAAAYRCATCGGLGKVATKKGE